MANKIRGQNTFFETQTFRQNFPPVIEPTTVALLPDPYPDGAVAPVTDDPENPVYLRKGGVWIPLGAAGGGGDLATFEPLTAPVDYNDPTAVDPDAGMVFTRQAEIDLFLSSHGATAFKHVQAVWEAMPVIVKHDITINLAAGIHVARTDSSYFAFYFGDKVQAGGNITVQGAMPSTWTLMDPTLTGLVIDSYSSPSTGDPYLDFSVSNPGVFAGMDLRGRFARLSTGQLCLIVRHTNSRLYVSQDPSPAPGPTDTAAVVRQSTILRNSTDGINQIHFYGGVAAAPLAPASDYVRDLFSLNNLLYEPPSTGVDLGFYVGSSSAYFLGSGITLDANRFAGTALIYGFEFYAASGLATYTSFSNSSFLAPRTSGGFAGGYISGSWSTLYAVYIQGFGEAVILSEGACRFMATTLDSVSTTGRSLVVINSSYLFDTHTFGVRRCEIVNSYGLKVSRGSRHMAVSIEDESWPNVNVWFQNTTGPCLLIGDNTHIDASYNTTGGLKDGGGNTDVGIELAGPGASAKLSDGTTVTGALGNVRTADGDVVSYTDIQALGPYVDSYGNMVIKQ